MNLDTSLQATPLVFLDLETTGLAPYGGDRICEMALVRVQGEVVQHSFTSFVDPERPLSERSAQINGIQPADLAGAPRFAALAGRLAAVCAGAVLVAHNAPFDIEFLQAELALAGLPPLLAPVIDTLPIARRLYTRRPSHSLGALAALLGAAAPTHRALSDVQALRVVFADMLAQLAALGVGTLGELLHYGRGFEPGEPAPPAPAPIGEALRAGRLLRVVYSSRTLPAPTERIIRPIEIIKQRRLFYLRAYCHYRQDLRVFAIERLSSIELVEEAED